MMLRLGIVQMNAEPLNVEGNLLKAEGYIAKCAADGAQLVVLPEMFNVGFHLGESLMMIAEPLDGKTVQWLQRQASAHNVYITGSIYERYQEHFYNTMVMVGYDGSVQHYRKRNPTWSEAAVWRRSDVPGPGIFDTPFGRIGGVICFDSFARETHEGFKQSGVEAVVIIALWGANRSRSFFWRPDLWLQPDRLGPVVADRLGRCSPPAREGARGPGRLRQPERHHTHDQPYPLPRLAGAELLLRFHRQVPRARRVGRGDREG